MKGRSSSIGPRLKAQDVLQLMREPDNAKRPHPNEEDKSNEVSEPSNIEPVAGPSTALESLSVQMEFPKPKRRVPTKQLLSSTEQYQHDIMSRKYGDIMTTMKTPLKLTHLFKCTGRFCAFSTDSIREAQSHMSCHNAIENFTDALDCPYCDYYITNGNPRHLIYHITKWHGSAPFCCFLCFYRAASCQSVESHLERVHLITAEPKKSVLRTVIRHLRPDYLDINAKRRLRTPEKYPVNLAVPKFCCTQIFKGYDGDELCNYRTINDRAFFEHTLTEHPGSDEFKCQLELFQMCTAVYGDIKNLIHHIKLVHGVGKYQCNRCYFGSDILDSMKHHYSLQHPFHEPKAYDRAKLEYRTLKINLPVAQVRDMTQNRHRRPSQYSLEEIMKSAALEVKYVPRVGPPSAAMRSLLYMRARRLARRDNNFIFLAVPVHIIQYDIVQEIDINIWARSANRGGRQQPPIQQRLALHRHLRTQGPAAMRVEQFRYIERLLRIFDGIAQNN